MRDYQHAGGGGGGSSFDVSLGMWLLVQIYLYSFIAFFMYIGLLCFIVIVEGGCVRGSLAS